VLSEKLPQRCAEQNVSILSAHFYNALTSSFTFHRESDNDLTPKQKEKKKEVLECILNFTKGIPDHHDICVPLVTSQQGGHWIFAVLGYAAD
jgi:hypothetical protein